MLIEKKHSVVDKLLAGDVIEPTLSLDDIASMNADAGDLIFALGSIACHTGEQAGALLLITQVLARNQLISAAEAKKLISLLSADLPEAQRHINAQCVLRRKTKPIGR